MSEKCKDKLSKIDIMITDLFTDLIKEHEEFLDISVNVYCSFVSSIVTLKRIIDSKAEDSLSDDKFIENVKNTLVLYFEQSKKIYNLYVN